jgi:putative OPT family oligopeptide transporter
MSVSNELQGEAADSPAIPANQSLPEITFRALIIGIILTIVLAAANAYLGLKVGQTISASIPAAIISMGILRLFRNSNVLENTMVQTMASVGEALVSGVAYILPALIILHAWDQFHYWQTFSISIIGGILGVLFTIPLRRALLRDKSLRFPEGVAITNVLKASAVKEKNDLRELIVGGAVGAVISFFQMGFQILTDSFQYWVRVSQTIFGFGLGLSPALIAAGYIVGINVGISLLAGIVIGWLIGVPVLSWTYGIPIAESTNDMAMMLWRSHMRYVGVGTMLLGALWTLLTLIKPIGYSIACSITTLRQAKKEGNGQAIRTERDIPINYIFWATLLLLIPIFWVICKAIIPADVSISRIFLLFNTSFCTAYIIIGGFIFCSIAAYFAGLIGSTNTPVSGLLVSSVLLLCLVFLTLFELNGSIHHGNALLGIVLAIGSTVIVGAAIGISNDTMQDLKVGQLLGATPWKQQFMLILGVVIASFIVPLILELLYNAYGIGGVFPRPDMDKSQMLSAPQAGLMAAVAQGVFDHNLEWSMIIIGTIVAVFCIIIDETLKPRGHRFPVLAVGLGVYLPLESSVPIVIGGILSYIVHRNLKKMYNPHDEASEQKIISHTHKGLLLCCGIVAGASIMGVVLAIPFAIYQRTDALRIMPVQLEPIAGILSIIVTFILCACIYRVVLKKKTSH